jgi:hypothetical protein
VFLKKDLAPSETALQNKKSSTKIIKENDVFFTFNIRDGKTINPKNFNF